MSGREYVTLRDEQGVYEDIRVPKAVMRQLARESVVGEEEAMRRLRELLPNIDWDSDA